MPVVECRAGFGLCGAIKLPLGNPVPWEELVEPALRCVRDAAEDTPLANPTRTPPGPGIIAAPYSLVRIDENSCA